MARPSKYNSKYHDDWAWSLAARDATDEEIAEAFGISKRTLEYWKKNYPSFDEALLNGKEAADSRVMKKLYERAVGYDYEETDIIQELDRNGNPKPAMIKKRKRHAPPDVMAQMYWLNNRMPAYYRRNTDSIATEASEEDDVVIYLPKNGRDENE